MVKDKYICDGLKNEKIFVLWKLENRTDSSGNVHHTKIPYSANYNGKASSTNENTWASYELTYAILQRQTQYNGIGIMMSSKNDIIFIDVDDCISDTGEYDARGKEILELFKGNFVEISQSGHGIHVLTRGKIPCSIKNSDKGIEMYSDKRFCALSGNILNDLNPIPSQEAIDIIFEKYKTKKKEKKSIPRTYYNCTRSDNDIIEKASASTNFVSLYNGRWKECGYESQSEADYRLCCILAFWTNCDTSAIDRIFRSSGLNREKWEEREDYRNNTISMAISECKETVSEFAKRKRCEEADELERLLKKRYQI